MIKTHAGVDIKKPARARAIKLTGSGTARGFMVRGVEGMKFRNGRTHYLIRWLNYSRKYNSWVDAAECNCDRAIARFNKAPQEVVIDLCEE